MPAPAALVLHGPNLYLLGSREPAIYGSLALRDLDRLIGAHARRLGLRVECRQSNVEGQLIDWLRENGVPHTVVATKTDKVKSAQRQRRKRELAEGCRLEPGDIVAVSATKGSGLDQLRSLVLSHIGAG